MTDVAIPVGANYVTLPLADVLMLAGLVGRDAPWETIEQMADDLAQARVFYQYAERNRKKRFEAASAA